MNEKNPSNTQTRSTDISEHSPNSSRASIVINASVKDWVMGLILASAVMMIGICAYVIDSYQREVRLKEYDLAAFKSEDFAQLKARVEADEKLLQQLLNQRSK